MLKIRLSTQFQACNWRMLTEVIGGTRHSVSYWWSQTNRLKASLFKDPTPVHCQHLWIHNKQPGYLHMYLSYSFDFLRQFCGCYKQVLFLIPNHLFLNLINYKRKIVSFYMDFTLLKIGTFSFIITNFT